jgi:hypothetical protein
MKPTLTLNFESIYELETFLDSFYEFEESKRKEESPEKESAVEGKESVIRYAEQHPDHPKNKKDLIKEPKKRRSKDKKLDLKVVAPKVDDLAPEQELSDESEETHNAMFVGSASPEIKEPYTREAVVDLLSKLNETKGMPKAREVLTKFQASRLSELKPEFYGPFCDECKKALSE